MGYKPVVFEAESKAGGMLVQTIPAYRLPREEIAREVRMIEQMGVTIQTGKRMGKDFTLKSLKEQGYEAVFVGVGAPHGSQLGLPGDKLEGVADAMSFLREFNLTGKTKVGENVVVVGGGNAAIDAARCALRLGAKTVNVIYRRTRAEMPAYAEEIDEAQREGVRLNVLVAPMEIVGEFGKVKGIKCKKMVLGEFDKTGRRSPKAGDEEFVMAADQVIGAIGQSLNTNEMLNGTDLRLNKRQYIDTNPMTCQTSVPWIFAGGDASTGPSSVAEAVGQGEKAAIGMDQFLTGSAHAFWREEKQVDTFFDPEADPVLVPRAKMRMIPVAKRRCNFAEVELTWEESTAVREAKRCLRCDFKECS
jgi:NADH-quinone oxidoreductase subunit F